MYDMICSYHTIVYTMWNSEFGKHFFSLDIDAYQMDIITVTCLLLKWELYKTTKNGYFLIHNLYIIYSKTLMKCDKNIMYLWKSVI